METSKGKIFSYPWYHLWRSVPFTVIAVGVAVFPIIGALIARDPHQARAAMMVAVMFWSIALYNIHTCLMPLWEPQTLQVDESGLVGKPFIGNVIRLDWSEIRSVEFPRISIFHVVKVMLIRGPQRKRMRLHSDLRGYEELKQIVLERTTVTPAWRAHRQDGMDTN